MGRDDDELTGGSSTANVVVRDVTLAVTGEIAPGTPLPLRERDTARADAARRGRDGRPTAHVAESSCHEKPRRVRLFAWRVAVDAPSAAVHLLDGPRL